MTKPVWLIAFLCGGVLLVPHGLNGGEAMRMQVSPAVGRAPADVTVRVSLEADSSNRSLEVSAESADFYRSSEIQIDGTNNPRLNVFEFRNLPTGLYQVTGVLVGINGRRAMVSRMAKVEPTFGR